MTVKRFHLFRRGFLSRFAAGIPQQLLTARWNNSRNRDSFPFQRGDSSTSCMRCACSSLIQGVSLMSDLPIAGQSTGTYDVDDVAALLKASPRHVRRMADAGRLPPPVHIGRLVRWPKSTIDEWLAAGAKPVRVATAKGVRRWA
jgi:excisionase family DNA binding protein